MFIVYTSSFQIVSQLEGHCVGLSVSEAAVSRLSFEKRSSREENVQDKVKGQPGAT